MHSSVKLERYPEETVQTLSLDLRVVQPPSKESATSQFRRIVVCCEVIADLVTIMTAVTAGYVSYGLFSLGKHIHYPLQHVVGVASVFAVVVVVMLDRVGAYRRSNSLLRVRETEQILRVSAQAFLFVFTVTFFSSFLFSRWVLLVCCALVPSLLIIQKNMMYLFVRALHLRGYGNEKVLIYGSGCTGRRVFSALRHSPKLGLDPIAFIDDDPGKTGNMVFEMGYEPRRPAPVLGGPVTKELLAEQRADLLIIAIPSLSREKFVRTVEEALGANSRVSFVPGNFLPSGSWVGYQDIDGVFLASFGKPAPRLVYEVAKRICDLAGSFFLSLLGLPLFLVVALLIKLDSEGPVLFRQKRVGQNGEEFIMYKFRTMKVGASPYDYSPQLSEDPRITRVGKFLRRTSFDELPQLFNVVLGQMSLVGPRPEMPFIVEQYTDRHRQRLHVKPGLTGLWQLSGDRAFLIHENVEYDLYYIQHRNFFMDLAIVLHTSLFAMRGV